MNQAKKLFVRGEKEKDSCNDCNVIEMVLNYAVQKNLNYFSFLIKFTIFDVLFVSFHFNVQSL